MRHLPGPVLVFVVEEPGRRLVGFYAYAGQSARRYRSLIPRDVLVSAPRVSEADARARGWLTNERSPWRR